MGTIFILGAGFSKTCGIATDIEMLETLNPLLDRPPQPKDPGNLKTSIEYFLEQSFPGQTRVSFELFMSTLSASKFLPDCLESDKNVFREEEQEIRAALRRYLKSCIDNVAWEKDGRAVMDFVRHVNWQHDFILTFNYDLLVEAAAKKLKLDVTGRIIHLHGAINERTLAWPTYTKFAYKTTKLPLARRWKTAFEVLRNQAKIDRLVFIGYSMPPSDLEAKSLFNYTDWYNHGPTSSALSPITANNRYSYRVLVVNPSEAVKRNYGFFRKLPEFHLQTLEEWLKENEASPGPNDDLA